MSSLQLALPLARTSEGMKAGPIGLAVILVLCIACYFLFKSMSKHLKTVRENFSSGDEDDPAAEAVDLGTAAKQPHASTVAQPDQPAEPQSSELGEEPPPPASPPAA